MILILVGIGGGTVTGGEDLQKFEFSQVHMGVPLNITVYADTKGLANNATAAAYDRVKELDQLLSDYKIDSELNQLSLQKTHGQPYLVSEDLFRVLETAEKVSEQSEGAFDVTVGPIVKLWRKARRQKKLPQESDLRERLAAVDYEAVRLDRKSRKVTLVNPGTRLDLGGIAKGYAADAVVDVLKQQGISRVLIDFGGDIVVGDPPPGKNFWTIAVAPLKDDSGKEAFQFIDLNNGSVATSGDAFQYVEIDGVRYSHIVDPRTGVGLTDRSSVTIIAPNGTLADAWASAVSVMGPERGMQMINNHPELEGFIIIEGGTFSSEGWSNYSHPGIERTRPQ